MPKRVPSGSDGSSPSYASSSTLTKYLRIHGEAQERKFVDNALDVLIHHKEFETRRAFELRRRSHNTGLNEKESEVHPVDNAAFQNYPTVRTKLTQRGRSSS